MGASFEGKGSEKRLEKDRQCPKCRRKGAYYLGSSVQHGNPFTPAADTDVDHYYLCARETCRHEWASCV